MFLLHLQQPPTEKAMVVTPWLPKWAEKEPGMKSEEGRAAPVAAMQSFYFVREILEFENHRIKVAQSPGQESSAHPK